MLYQRKKNSTKIKLKRSKKQKALECYCESFDGSEDARKNIKKKKKKKEKGQPLARSPSIVSVPLWPVWNFFFLLQSRRRKRLNRVQMARYRRAVSRNRIRARLRPVACRSRPRPRIQGTSKSRAGRTPWKPGWWPGDWSCSTVSTSDICICDHHPASFVQLALWTIH